MERFGMGVVVVKEAVDGRREVGDGSEDDLFKASLGEDGQEAFDRVVSRMIAFVPTFPAVRSTICPRDMLLRRVASLTSPRSTTKVGGRGVAYCVIRAPENVGRPTVD